jgi:polysaccharide biosynthesis protein PslH
MRVLFLTHRLPYAPNRGDRIRAYHLLKELSRSFEVDVLSLVHDAEEASHVDSMRGLASSVVTARSVRWRNAARTAAGLLTTIPATHTMLDAAELRSRLRSHIVDRRPDVVLAYCSGVARLATLREMRSTPLVLDMVDVDSLKWSSLAAKSSAPLAWLYKREARLLGRFERTITRQANATLVTTPAEQEALAFTGAADRIHVVQNGIDVGAFRPSALPGQSSTVVFCGVMNYAPNIEAVLWLARHVWPLVRAERPDARLQIVGATPAASVLELASAAHGIEVTGGVPDVRPYLWQAAASAAPLFVARGIQNKVLEAAAARLPVVVTSEVAKGLPSEIRERCRVADEPESFARALVSLLAEPPASRASTFDGVDFEELAWPTRLRVVPGLLRAAVDEGPLAAD